MAKLTRVELMEVAKDNNHKLTTSKRDDMAKELLDAKLITAEEAGLGSGNSGGLSVAEAIAKIKEAGVAGNKITSFEPTDEEFLELFAEGKHLRNKELGRKIQATIIVDPKAPVKKGNKEGAFSYMCNLEAPDGTQGRSYVVFEFEPDFEEVYYSDCQIVGAGRYVNVSSNDEKTGTNVPAGKTLFFGIAPNPSIESIKRLQIASAKLNLAIQQKSLKDLLG